MARHEIHSPEDHQIRSILDLSQSAFDFADLLQGHDRRRMVQRGRRTRMPRATLRWTFRTYNTVMPDYPATTSDAIAFPELDASDLASLRPLATSCFFEDGQTVFSVGDADLDLFVVEAGAIEIVNPSEGIVE
jgi:hypothetical protein